MIYIKKFLDKMTAVESRQNKDVVLPIMEARGLRDEISKLLADLHELTDKPKNTDDVLEIQIKGGSFK